MIFDCHMHTKFSADSEMLATDAINKAQHLNLGIIFTEHFDYNIAGNFIFNPAEYMSEYKNLRNDTVKLGVEVGLRKSARNANANFIAAADFDMVIGSIHVIDDFDIYYPDFYIGKDKLTAYRKYFAVMAEEAAVEDFDTLGHIDYICRAAPYDNPEIDYATFKTEIDNVLKIIVERGKIIELNTRRFDNIRSINELIPIYKQYKNLGGKYVTIGSDAHRVEVVGAHFDKTLDFVNEVGLTPVSFNRRKMVV